MQLHSIISPHNSCYILYMRVIRLHIMYYVVYINVHLIGRCSRYVCEEFLIHSFPFHKNTKIKRILS